MATSAAERMREYRKRLKQDPEKYQDYLTKAKQRKRRNYTPVTQLTKTEKQKRREKTRQYVEIHRKKKKLETVANVQNESVVSETSGYETNTPDSQRPLIVNLPFPNRRNGPRKRVSRALATKHREYNDLKLKFDVLQKRYKRNMRSLQRYKKSNRGRNVHETHAECSNNELSENDFLLHNEPSNRTPNAGKRVDIKLQEPNTPRSKTKQMLADAGLNKKQSAKIRKQLLLANVMQTQVEKCRRGIKRSELGALRGLIGGRILSKYKLAKTVSKSTGLGRNRIAKGVSGVSINVKSVRREREVERYKARVLTFLERDDNSRCNPGKQDKLKVNGETHQTRILTDYLKNLYLKFQSENPGVKLSLASFCRIRPANIKLTRFISRSCCLCTKHQNFALCTQSLRKCGLNVPLNPEKFVEDDAYIEKMKSDTPEEISIGQWKRVSVEDKGKTKMIMKVVTCKMTKTEFLKHMEAQIGEFKAHVNRVRRQYQESIRLKQELPKGEVIVNMDFAENYGCKSVEEIQSAYWNQTAVTLHPVVMYFKQNTDELKHQSIVVVSDEMGHNSSTVLTILDKIMPKIKYYVPNVRKVHYFTDSPTSQYRNKTIFNVIANHEELYSCQAIWNYFEAGHGKGPCDGLGGTTKRMADDAVKSGKATIQDAADFFQWTQSENCTMKTVQFMFVSSTDCQQKSRTINTYDIKPIKGTMKIHAVVGRGNNLILTSNVSCYCTDCIKGEACMSNQWTHNTLNVTKTDVVTHDSQPKSTPTISARQPDLTTEISLQNKTVSLRSDVSIGDFVAARYDGKVYIGKVLECDDDDGEVEITFMQHVRKLLQWPKHEDKIWIDRQNVICIVSEPIPTGKSKRMYRLTDDDLKNIEINN